MLGFLTVRRGPNNMKKCAPNIRTDHLQRRRIFSPVCFVLVPLAKIQGTQLSLLPVSVYIYQLAFPMKRNADSLPTRSVSEFRWTVSQRSSIESPLCTTTKLEWGKGKQKRKEKEATWAAEEEERLTTENNVAYKRRTHLSTNWLAAEKLPERNLPNGKNFTTKNSTKERERNKREKKKKERPKLQEWERKKQRLMLTGAVEQPCHNRRRLISTDWSTDLKNHDSIWLKDMTRSDSDKESRELRNNERKKRRKKIKEYNLFMTEYRPTIYNTR